MSTLEQIYAVVDELNLDFDENHKLVKSKETIIFGHDSILDSMGLINFITLLEEKIEEKTGKFIPIADERAMSLTENPFKTIGTLSLYIDRLLNEQ
jgi:hypothetical protein